MSVTAAARNFSTRVIGVPRGLTQKGVMLRSEAKPAITPLVEQARGRRKDEESD